MRLFLLSKSVTSTALDISEVALLFFGLLLVVGLIGEYAESDRWKKHVKVFTMCVIIGVAGELFADGGIFLFSRHLQTIAEKEIADLTQTAGNARTSADKAADAASRAGKAADHAETVAGRAVNESSDAMSLAHAGRKAIGQLRTETKELNDKLLAAKAQLETVEAKRAALEKSLINLAVCNAPRVIPFWSVGKTKTSIDPLKLFAGRQAVIEFEPDTEARRAALSIATSLDRAGWKIIKLYAVDGIDDGVEIQAYFKSASGQKSMEEGLREWQIHVRSSEAVDALIDFLHSYNWQARMGWASPGANDIPPDGLKVRVGLYPAVTYVSPPGAKDLESAIAQFEQEREKNRKQLETERLKREEEILKQLSPQQAMEFKARREEWNKSEKLWMERYSGPCQPLTPLSPSLR